MASEHFFKYDAFISYAVEDKEGIVNELVEKLEDLGIKIWYASKELQVGRGINETIKEGLNQSRHGIIILSHNYFAKEWPKKEMHVLWSMEKQTERIILPVWHNIKEEDIKKHDPFLADNYGLNSEKGIDHVSRELACAIKESRSQLTTAQPGTLQNRKKNISSNSTAGSALKDSILFLMYLIEQMDGRFFD